MIQPKVSPLVRATLAGATLTLVTLLAPGAWAQDVELPAPSPKARVEQKVGVTQITLDYSSPAVKKRKVFGAGDAFLVPFDKLWRAGANRATKLEASRDFTFGGTAVKAGAYAIYMIPGKASWQVILNSNWNTGGTGGYDEAKNVAKVTVKPQTLSPARERLLYFFNDTTDSGTKLELEWDKVKVSVPITVDTAGHAAAALKSSVDGAWRPHFTAAQYLFDNSGDMNQALGYIDQSIAIRSVWANHWWRAQILGKLGKKAEARAAAEKAVELGKDDQSFQTNAAAQVAKAIDGWK